MSEGSAADDEHVSTYTRVTDSYRNGGKEGGGKEGEASPEADLMRPRTRVRARDWMVAAVGAATRGVQLDGASWRRVEREKTPEEAAAPDIHENTGGNRRHFWHDGPAPAADLVAYTRSGAWLQGKRNDWLEWAGMAWGYVVALPLTLALGALIWCSHRFHRALTLVVVAAVLWVSAPAWGGDAQPPSPAVPSQTGAAP